MRPRLRPSFLALACAVAVGGTASARADDAVAIVGLDGVDLGRWTGRGDLVAEDAHCVGVTPGHGPPRFHLEAFGDGPAGRFELTNGASRLPFVLHYDDGTGPRRLDPGRLLAHLRGAPATPGLRRCLRGDGAARNRIEVRVRERDLARVTAGRFHGRVVLMIVPE